MTNKPMLSVERKVIEDILADTREPGTDYMAARKALRALLDKEVDGDSHAPKCQGEPVARISLEQVRKAYDYATEHPDKYLRGTSNWCAAVAHSLDEQNPAAQNQSEPVAYRVMFNDGEKSKWEDGMPQSQDLYDVRDGVIRGVERAYAEQPAPVAVVMPDRMEVEPFTTIDRGSKNYKAGYNVALAEVARLNGVKP